MSEHVGGCVDGQMLESSTELLATRVLFGLKFPSLSLQLNYSVPPWVIDFHALGSFV